jgi:hypothetical protein
MFNRKCGFGGDAKTDLGCCCNAEMTWDNPNILDGPITDEVRFSPSCA